MHLWVVGLIVVGGLAWAAYASRVANDASNDNPAATHVATSKSARVVLDPEFITITAAGEGSMTVPVGHVVSLGIRTPGALATGKLTLNVSGRDPITVEFDKSEVEAFKDLHDAIRVRLSG